MFNGELGYKLVASVESYPTLGPFNFPDQETTQYHGLVARSDPLSAGRCVHVP